MSNELLTIDEKAEQDPRLLTVKETADRLRVKPVTVYAWIKEGRFPHVVLSAGAKKKCVRCTEDQVRRFVLDRKRG